MNIIKKLNSINAEDIKNYDWAQLKDRLLSQPESLIKIGIISFTVIAVALSFRMYTASKKSMKSTLTNLQNKTQAIDNLEATQKQYNNFINSIPKTIPVDQLIEILSATAIKWDVQILSFSPANEKNNGNINLTNVEINIISENYKNIVLFMHDIENSEYSIRIGRVSGSSGTINQRNSRRRSGRRTIENSNTKEYITVTVAIESLEFKNG